MTASPAQRTRWTAFTVVLGACLLVSLVCVGFPIYVIRPFRAQGARELAVALVVARFRPTLTVLSAIAVARRPALATGASSLESGGGSRRRWVRVWCACWRCWPASTYLS